MKHLILAPAWVGDMVMAHTLVQVLHAQDPDAQVDMLAPPATLSLAARMPGVTAGLELPVAHGQLALGQRLRIANRLRRGAGGV